jgi:hypothetical protein
MSFLHFVFSDAKKYWQKGGFLNLSFFHYLIGNGLANIYIHNWIRLDGTGTTARGNTDINKQGCGAGSAFDPDPMDSESGSRIRIKGQVNKETN